MKMPFHIQYQLQYTYARNYYTIVREMPSRKGYADMILIPKDDKPAMIIELKWNQDVENSNHSN